MEQSTSCQANLAIAEEESVHWLGRAKTKAAAKAYRNDLLPQDNEKHTYRIERLEGRRQVDGAR